MSLNLLNTTAARMAFFLVGSRALVAGETEKHETLYVLNAADREALGWDALALIAESQDWRISQADIIGAACLWATSDDEAVAFALDYAQVLSEGL